ncbi:SIS domain-containing protein [Domibacillus sp. DTU_2020_1001157_1_SI_ALB_TIR_016]|uniref:SIS domain-containing protein n=1 Tax=Domibacillus sp. DTU_2020_1001157_1_SI_ALB_TIR_016 TaxID=3077789 RepID=UPI0028E26C1E|nr:SIS domain-containing protein [Domibacillus sp. DTU_2020_1001157_1_SI_ALB_TIR_016]WNS78060.1 SIS domain-containing protein [Domibacillus sp. DTU_2020_1001157_1_SI_ALB_TIR_016]
MPINVPNLNENVKTILNGLENRNITDVFFVACGGSLAVMYANKYYLDRYSRALRANCYNSDEFVYRNPVALSEHSLVVLCSQTGTTKETVRAAAFAKSKGAITVGMTVDKFSPLAKEVDYILEYEASYTTGIPIDAVKSNYSVMYQLDAGLVKLFDGVDRVSKTVESLMNLQTVIDKAQEQYDEMGTDFAHAFKDEKVIYTISSGLSYGSAYSYAICVLMEMQWIHSQAIHAGEFFHGPFEVLDESVPFILLKGIDETRPIEDRAHDFLSKYGGKLMVLDANEIDFLGIDEEMRAYVTPLVFFEVLWKFSYKLADLRNHPMLEGRRYMKKFAY